MCVIVVLRRVVRGVWVVGDARNQVHCHIIGGVVVAEAAAAGPPYNPRTNEGQCVFLLGVPGPEIVERCVLVPVLEHLVESGAILLQQPSHLLLQGLAMKTIAAVQGERGVCLELRRDLVVSVDVVNEWEVLEPVSKLVFPPP